MTLPNINKPSIDNTVSDIVSHIKANLDYLDGTLAKFKHVYVTKDLSTVESNLTQTVSGVGFTPSTILMFSANPLANCIAVGTYGNFVGSGTDDNCVFLQSTFKSASTVVSYLGSHTATITSVNSDGFVLTWTGSNIASTAVLIAFCIR